MEKIAILTSTSPLRKTTTRHGVTKQRLNQDALDELTDRFDVVIIGSLSHDDVFEYVARHIPRGARHKFRLYPRSFFHGFDTAEVRRRTDDIRNPAWERILSENDVQFEVLRSRLRDDHKYDKKRFNWRELDQFVSDPRVTLVAGSEGQLFYEKPEATKK